MAVQATARGTLGVTPLPNLLVYALDRRLTGTIVFEDGERRKHAILFRGGGPRKVKLGGPVARLADILVERGVLDRERARTTFERAQSERRLHGDWLQEMGVIDAAALDEALTEQILRKVAWMTELGPETVFGYYDGQDFLAAYGGRGTVVDPLEVIWGAFRAGAKPDVVDATLERLGSQEIRLHPSSRVGRFGFDARERGFLDVVRLKPQPLPDLLSSGLLPAPKMKLVLCALAVTRHLDLSNPAARPAGVEPSGATPAGSRPGSLRPNVPAASSDAGAERSLPRQPEVNIEAAPYRAVQATLPPQLEGAKPDVAAFQAEIAALSGRLPTMDFYELIGVERSAPATAIQAAYFQLAKRWHPDRLDPGLGEGRDLAAKVFARMSEAHQVLSNDEQRREYDRLAESAGQGAAEQEVIQRVLRAATAFQKAEVFIRRGNLEEAEAQIQDAVANDPDQAEYAALYADVLSQRRELARTPEHGDLVKMVNEARKKEPQNLRVRFYRARVLRRSGDSEGAYREFKSIVEQDASNVEAAREVRLYELRRSKQPGFAKSGSTATASATGKDIGQIFSKLFKRPGS